MNSSEKNLTSVDPQKLVQYSLFIFSGTFAFIGSFLILIVICLNRELHSKHYYLLCGLAGGDAIQAIGYLFGGIRRLYVVATLQDITVRVTPFRCMLEFYNSFFIVGQESSMLMIFCISLDRFLALKAYNHYRTLGSRYAVLLIAIVYAHCLVVIAVGWYASAYLMVQQPIYSLICFSPYTVPSGYFDYHSIAQLLPGLGSIILYVTAFLKASAVTKVQPITNNVQLVEKRRQAQLTKKVAVVIFLTFFGTTVPFGTVSLFNILGLNTSNAFTAIAPYMWMLACSTTGLNIFVYARNYPKFRKGLKKFLRRGASQSEDQTGTGC